MFKEKNIQSNSFNPIDLILYNEVFIHVVSALKFYKMHEQECKIYQKKKQLS